MPMPTNSINKRNKRRSNPGFLLTAFLAAGLRRFDLVFFALLTI
jgi:hypothetical protein